MKKIILIIVGILLVSLVTAGIVMRDTFMDLKPVHRQALTRVGKGIDNIEISEMTCNGEECKVTLYEKGAINTDITILQYYDTCIRMEGLKEKRCEEWQRTYYTDAELEELRDALIKRRLTEIAKVRINRESEVKEVKLDEGRVIVR